MADIHDYHRLQRQNAAAAATGYCGTLGIIMMQRAPYGQTLDLQIRRKRYNCRAIPFAHS